MRRIYVKRTDHVDHETGEITYSESESSFFVKSRHFVKFFAEQAHLLKDLSGGARYFLDLLLLEMDFNTNQVYVSADDRRRFAQVFQRSEHTIRNYIQELKAAGVIAKKGSNVYRINPALYQKGGKHGTPEEKYERIPDKYNNNGKSPL